MTSVNRSRIGQQLGALAVIAAGMSSGPGISAAAGAIAPGRSDQISVSGLIFQVPTSNRFAFVSTGCSLTSTDEPGQPVPCFLSARGVVAGAVFQANFRAVSIDGTIRGTVSLCGCGAAGTGSGVETDRDTRLATPVDVSAQLTSRAPASPFVTRVSLMIDVVDRANPGPAVFATPGTFSYTVPSGIRSLHVTVVGGGGGGAGANSATIGGGGGGGSGGASTSTLAVAPGDVCTVSVGGGGAGGAGRTGPFGREQPGVSGGGSSVSCPSGTLSATGGTGGLFGTGGAGGRPGGNSGQGSGAPVTCPGPGTAAGGAGGVSPAGGAGSGGAGGSSTCTSASPGAPGASGEVVITPA